MDRDLWFIDYGLMFLVCGLRLEVYVLWPLIFGLWFDVGGFVVCGLRIAVLHCSR